MNPIPFTIGGETTDIEDAWRALRALVGGEHGPGPEGGVEDLARQVKAERIAFAERAFERAFLQLFPGTSTDALPIWEELTLTSGADTAVALRELVERAWRARRAATTPVLAEELRAISSQLSIAIEPDAETIVTEPGKYAAPAGGSPPYGLTSPAGLSSAVLPNLASRDVLRVRYALTAAEDTIPEDVTREVGRLLHERLPSWQTWTLCQIGDDGPGFYLDGGTDGRSRLGVTAFG